MARGSPHSLGLSLMWPSRAPRWGNYLPILFRVGVATVTLSGLSRSIHLKRSSAYMSFSDVYMVVSNF